MIIDGVDYMINWTKFTKGTSFFIPCLDSTKAKEIIKEICTLNGHTNVAMYTRIEEGIRGIRVWKL